MLTQLSVVIACASPVASFAQGGGGVQFKFDWKPGTVAEVSTTMAVKATGAKEQSSTTPQRFSIDAHADGLLVRTGPMPGAPAPAADAELAAKAMAQSESEYIVGADGKFIRMADMAKVQRMVDSSLAMLQRQSPGMPPEMLAPMKASMNPTVIEATTQQGHLQSTTSFLGREWQIGKEVVDSVRLPSPMVPGSFLSVKQRTTIVAVEACSGTAPASRCARVKRTALLDANALRPQILELMRRTAPAGVSQAELEAAMPEVSVETTSESLLEVATLLPHRIDQRMTQNMRLMGSNQRTLVTTTATYTYAPR